MAAISPAPRPAVAPSPNTGPASSDYSPDALRTPTIIFLAFAVLVIVISILLVWRHLYRTWRNVMPEEPGASEGVAAQQDKELSLVESQLHRSTPIVVLQPDSRVMCAHKDQIFVEAAMLKAQHPDGGDGSGLPLDTAATGPRASAAPPVITDLSALPPGGTALPGHAAAGQQALAGIHSSQAQHGLIPSHPGLFYQDAGEAGSSSDLHSQGAVAEQGEGEGGGFHFRQPGFGQGQPGFSHRHRNESAVSLSSLAGSDVSTCSTTYVTELPEGSSLFYEGPHEYEPRV